MSQVLIGHCVAFLTDVLLLYAANEGLAGLHLCSFSLSALSAGPPRSGPEEVCLCCSTLQLRAQFGKDRGDPAPCSCLNCRSPTSCRWPLEELHRFGLLPGVETTSTETVSWLSSVLVWRGLVQCSSVMTSCRWF